MEVLLMVIVFILLIGFGMIGPLIIPYIVCICLAIKGVNLLSLYLYGVLGNLYQSIKLNCARRKSKKLLKCAQIKSKNLIDQRFLTNSKLSLNKCIFVPCNIVQESTQRLDKEVVRIRGFEINLFKEKIENCIYPVEELSPLTDKGLYVFFNQYKKVSDIVQGITLMHKMLFIRERRILPILKTYHQLARNCNRDSDQMLSDGIIGDIEGFERYRDELYDKTNRLTHILSVEWQDIVMDIYKAIKLGSNYFVVDSFIDIIARIDELETFIKECEISQELYSNLAYRTFG